MRLNRYLASAGLGSRRGVEDLIKAGRVRINGRVVTDLATQVAPEDSVKVGSRVVHVEHSIHAVLYKPKGFVCTASDEQGRRTIFDLLPRNWPRVFHVGRLDRESEGLLIVTNDGDLALTLTHPRYHIDKEYEVRLAPPFNRADRPKLLRGFRIEGGFAKMEEVVVVSGSALRIVLRQGIKRQIRMMFYELGYEVTHLRRVRIGSLKMGAMQPGDWRLLRRQEIEGLKASAQSPQPAQGPPTRKGAKIRRLADERGNERQSS